MLSLHGIPDGRLSAPVEFDEAYYAPHQGPSWPDNDGINIIGTPLGSPEFIKQYLQGKHTLLLDFITDVAKMGFSRHAHKMLTRTAIPRLSHVLKSVPKDASSIEWMKYVDKAHLSTWLSCVKATALDTDLSSQERDRLSSSQDLYPLSSGALVYNRSYERPTRSC
jgi:hypothetical protein